MTATITAEALSVGYDGTEIVHGVDVTLEPGSLTVLIGANGCGKSTLLRGLARLNRPMSGRVLLDGVDTRSIPRGAFASRLGLLPQQPAAPDGILVADLVARGRYPHQGWFRRWTHDDDRAVADALERTGLVEVADRAVSELSGGQRQRVWIAMVLCQDPDVMLLDEPTSFLDIAHQIEVMDVLTELNRTRGTTIGVVLHELNLAARYATRLVVMSAGRVVASGPPADVLTDAVVAEAFGLRSTVVPDPVSGTPMVVPRGRFHGA
ncbi:ABC transporter ATP-binding protein [Humibacter sp. BT305]|nr:ABC transporter ATP-binding protein [Humibacter sp. BT305]